MDKSLAEEAYRGGYEPFRNKWIGDHEEMCADLVRYFVPRATEAVAVPEVEWKTSSTIPHFANDDTDIADGFTVTVHATSPILPTPAAAYGWARAALCVGHTAPEPHSSDTPTAKDRMAEAFNIIAGFVAARKPPRTVETVHGSAIDIAECWSIADLTALLPNARAFLASIEGEGL